MNRGFALAALTSLAALGAFTLAPAALAQDDTTTPQPPPTIKDDAVGPIQEAQTVAAEDVEEKERRTPGWNPGISIGAGFNLINTRSVVGQQDGTTITLGGGFDSGLEFNEGMHEWRNALIASAGMARTPTLDEFVKTNDGLSFESIYLLHLIEIFGPFARFGLNTQMFSANNIQPSPVDYLVNRLDGTTDEFTGRRLGLTDPFQPLNLRQSVGVFVQPLSEPEIELEARTGLGAMETFAEGGLAVNDDDATDVVEVDELNDSWSVGGEAVVNAWGSLDDAKRISYTVGISALLPFATSDLAEGDDRNLVELTTVEARAGLNVKLFDWASLTYNFAALRQPLLVEDWQISNSLLLTIGAAFGSKAAQPEEPPPCECDELPADATGAEAGQAGAEGAEAEVEGEDAAPGGTGPESTDAPVTDPPPAPPPPEPAVEPPPTDEPPTDEPEDTTPDQPDAEEPAPEEPAPDEPAPEEPTPEEDTP